MKSGNLQTSKQFHILDSFFLLCNHVIVMHNEKNLTCVRACIFYGLPSGVYSCKKSEGENEIFIRLLIFHLSNLLGVYGAAAHCKAATFHLQSNKYISCDFISSIEIQKPNYFKKDLKVMHKK